MPIGNFVEYEDAGEEVRAVYDDIMATRGVDWINNFWKALAQDPATLGSTSARTSPAASATTISEKMMSSQS